MLDGSFYTKILEVNLFAFTYRLFHEDFSAINRALKSKMFMHESSVKNTNSLMTSCQFGGKRV